MLRSRGRKGAVLPPAAGVTLLEVLIAVTLLSLLIMGTAMSMRLGLFTFSHTDAKLMENRRVAGAQRVLDQELEGLIPVVAPCAGAPGSNPRTAMFQGLGNSLTLVSAFSLQEAWRGRPQLLQLFVIPAQAGGGVRLVVNETPYAGPLSAGRLCTGVQQDPATGASLAQFQEPRAASTTFVLADNLAYCRFRYLTPSVKLGEPGGWLPGWTMAGWPAGIRIEMAPAEPNPARLQPITVTAPMYLLRNPMVLYADR